MRMTLGLLLEDLGKPVRRTHVAAEQGGDAGFDACVGFRPA